MNVPELIRQFFAVAALGLEVLGVLVIVVGVFFVSVSRSTLRGVFRLSTSDVHIRYRHLVARPLLFGLDLLVAADIVHTVTLEPSFTNVAALGAIVLVRVFLSWSIAVEVEGRWPWESPNLEERSRARQAVTGGA